MSLSATAQPGQLALVFKAFSDPNRIRIYQCLQKGDASVGDLAQTLRLRQNLVSMHLRVLRKAGYVAAKVQGKQRIYHRRSAEVCDLLAQGQATALALGPRRLDPEPSPQLRESL
jgi:DNA-binding transcriptional ArsR family regulator